MTRHSFARRIVSTVNVAVSIQIGLSMVSIGRGTGLVEEKSKLLDSREVFDASHYKLVMNYVAHLYSSGRFSPSQLGVKLAESATWEDPKCIFQGTSEIRQAFRISSHKLAASPRCVNVEPKGETIVLTYAVPYKKYNQESLVKVNVQMHQMKQSPEFNEFIITKMEEQWNGIPLFQSLLFWIVRRINGVAAYHFSSGLGW